MRVALGAFQIGGGISNRIALQIGEIAIPTEGSGVDCDWFGYDSHCQADRFLSCFHRKLFLISASNQDAFIRSIRAFLA